MTVQICSCKGLNSTCKKCFGSGYINSPALSDPNFSKKERKSVEKRKIITISDIPENINSLEKLEIQNITLDIIALIDLKSKKQMQILNSLPFSTNTFRRDFKDKFADLKELEDEKRILRHKLNTIIDITISKKYAAKLSFKHYLSNIDIDVDSNRQLKDLIKEYKRLKSN